MTKIKPHAALTYIRPDEVAECWDGVTAAGLYDPLWDCVPAYDKAYMENIEDIGPHDVVGINSVKQFWARFSDEDKVKLNTLAEEQDAKQRRWESELVERRTRA